MSQTNDDEEDYMSDAILAKWWVQNRTLIHSLSKACDIFEKLLSYTIIYNFYFNDFIFLF